MLHGQGGEDENDLVLEALRLQNTAAKSKPRAASHLRELSIPPWAELVLQAAKVQAAIRAGCILRSMDTGRRVSHLIESDLASDQVALDKTDQARHPLTVDKRHPEWRVNRFFYGRIPVKNLLSCKGCDEPAPEPRVSLDSSEGASLREAVLLVLAQAGYNLTRMGTNPGSCVCASAAATKVMESQQFAASWSTYDTDECHDDLEDS